MGYTEETVDTKAQGILKQRRMTLQKARPHKMKKKPSNCNQHPKQSLLQERTAAHDGPKSAICTRSTRVGKEPDYLKAVP